MEIRFGYPERERIVIAIPEQHPKDFKGSLEGWLSANVEIQTGGFSGNVSLFLDTSDFERFLPQARRLYETLKGEAQFETTEGQIRFVLKEDGQGHITLIGHLKDKCGIGNELSFKLEFDQTLLQHSISEIERFLNTTTRLA